MAPFSSEQQKRFVLQLWAAAALLLQAGHEIKKKKRKKRKWWVPPWSSERQRGKISFSSVYSLCFTFRFLYEAAFVFHKLSLLCSACKSTEVA